MSSGVIFTLPPPASPQTAAPPSSPPTDCGSCGGSDDDDPSSGTPWWLPLAIALPATALVLLLAVVAVAWRYPARLRAAERSIRRMSGRNFADIQAGQSTEVTTGTDVVGDYRASLDALPAVPSAPMRADSGSPLDLAMAQREPLRVKATYAERPQVAGMLCRAAGGTRGRPQVELLGISERVELMIGKQFLTPVPPLARACAPPAASPCRLPLNACSLSAQARLDPGADVEALARAAAKAFVRGGMNVQVQCIGSAAAPKGRAHPPVLGLDC